MTGRTRGPMDRRFALMFLVMLTIAAGNTALQSILPALGRSLKVADSAVAAVSTAATMMRGIRVISGHDPRAMGRRRARRCRRHCAPAV